MLIPSIDIMNGRAVQLIGGREKVIDAGDPIEVARRFRIAGEIAVIDLDAAKGSGSNANLIRQIIRHTPCRVGGGIRSVEQALDWLDAGAEKVILGTAAAPDVLAQLPRDRTMAALDAEHGEVVVEGWQAKTGATIEQRMDELRDHVWGFLVTCVEREGRMEGIDLSYATSLRAQAGEAALTIAGGVTTIEEIAALDEAGMDAQVGMAIYSGKLTLADAAIAPLLARASRALRSEAHAEGQDGDETERARGLRSAQTTAPGSAQTTAPGSAQTTAPGSAQTTASGSAQTAAPVEEELWPTVVVDEHGIALGLAWSNRESVRKAFEIRRGVYHSRERGTWVKGETSGASQDLLRVALDCDRDALRFTVRQRGAGFCHNETRTCWGDDAGLPNLMRRIRSRLKSDPTGSYTRQLVDDPELLKAKIREEAEELCAATTADDLTHEAADVLYFTFTRLAASGIDLHDVEEELRRRSLRVRRRSEPAAAGETA